MDTNTNTSQTCHQITPKNVCFLIIPGSTGKRTTNTFIAVESCNFIRQIVSFLERKVFSKSYYRKIHYHSILFEYGNIFAFKQRSSLESISTLHSTSVDEKRCKSESHRKRDFLSCLVSPNQSIRYNIHSGKCACRKKWMRKLKVFSIQAGKVDTIVYRLFVFVFLLRETYFWQHELFVCTYFCAGKYTYTVKWCTFVQSSWDIFWVMNVWRDYFYGYSRREAEMWVLHLWRIFNSDDWMHRSVPSYFLLLSRMRGILISFSSDILCIALPLTCSNLTSKKSVKSEENQRQRWRYEQLLSEKFDVTFTWHHSRRYWDKEYE